MMSSKNNWNAVNVLKGTIFDTLNSNFLKTPSAMPSFRDCETLIMGSDYSGESKEEPYLVYSFILTGNRPWDVWEKKRMELRKQIMPDHRRMSYKKLGDHYRQEFLNPLLETADQMEGLLLTIAVNKNVPSIFSDKGPLNLSNSEFSMFRKWKPSVLEKAFYLMHFAGFLLAGLGHKNQNIFWFTDQDEVAANAGMLSDFLKAFSWISSNYLSFDFGHLRIGTTSCDNGSRQIEDFVAIPDLVAGAISEQFRWCSSIGLKTDKVLWLTGREMRTKAQSILLWYATMQKCLKKHVFVVDSACNGKSQTISWFNYTHE